MKFRELLLGKCQEDCSKVDRAVKYSGMREPEGAFC